MLGVTTTDKAADWDDDLLLEASQTSPWLFTVLVQRYEEPFLRKAKSVVRNPLDAEEVVQDAFTKIYVNAHKYQPQSGAKFSSWAYRIRSATMPGNRAKPNGCFSNAQIAHLTNQRREQ